MIRVVDLSAAQDVDIDLEAAREAGIIAAIVKLTEGATHLSPTWLAHSSSVKAAGLILGVYHFAWPNRPVEQDAAKEAGKLIGKIRELEKNGLLLDMYPALDIEKGKDRVEDEELVAWTAEFADILCQFGYPRIIVYANKSYCRMMNRGAEKLGHTHGLHRYPLWLAGDNPSVPRGIWTQATLWQTPQRRVGWYSGKIDCNHIVGPLEDLLIPRQAERLPMRLEKMSAELLKMAKELREGG